MVDLFNPSSGTPPVEAGAPLHDVSAKAFNPSAQSIPTGTFTALSVPSAQYDTAEFHDDASPTKLTVPCDGKYHVGGVLAFAAAAAGVRNVGIQKNGGSFLIMQGVASAGGDFDTVLSLHTEVLLSKGDYIELVGFQSSGGDLDIRASSETTQFGCELWIRKVDRAG